MLDVVEIVAHLLRLFLQVVRIAIADLRPAGDSRPHQRAQPVIGNGPGEQVEVGHGVRPGTDEIDVTAQDVHELGQLVEAELAQPPAGPGDALVVVPGPLRGRPAGRMHGPELQELEPPPFQADALLDEQGRATRVEPDQQGDERHEGGGCDQPRRRDHDAERPRQDLMNPGAGESGKGQGARRDRLDGDLAGEAFQDLDPVLDRDSPHTRLEKTLHRQPAAPIVQGHDDPVGRGQGQDGAEIVQRTEHRRRHQGRQAVARLRDDADDGVAGAGPGFQLMDDLSGQRASPQHQVPSQERPERGDAVHQRPQRQDQGDRRGQHHDQRGRPRPGRRDHLPDDERQAQGEPRRTRQAGEERPERAHGAQVIELLVVEGDDARQGERQGPPQRAGEVDRAARPGSRIEVQSRVGRRAEHDALEEGQDQRHAATAFVRAGRCALSARTSSRVRP